MPLNVSVGVTSVTRSLVARCGTARLMLSDQVSVRETDGTKRQVCAWAGNAAIPSTTDATSARPRSAIATLPGRNGQSDGRSEDIEPANLNL